MRRDARRLLRSLLIALLIGLGVNTVIAVLFDGKTMLAALRSLDPRMPAVPFLCYFLIYLIDTFRLSLVLRQYSYRVRIRDGFLNSVLTILLSNLTPMAAGGQPFQIYHLTQLGVDSKKAANIVLSRHVEYIFTSLAVFTAFFPTALRLARSVNIAGGLFYAGFALSGGLGFVFLAVLVRPDLLGKIGKFLDRTAAGAWVARLTGRKNWADGFHNWSKVLRKEVAFLWSEKFGVMAADIALGFVNLGLQAFSLWYALAELTQSRLSFFEVFVAFNILSLIVFYVPTPGAGGSVEAAYILVFSGLTGSPELTALAVLVWRWATYYLHIFFGFLVLLLFPFVSGAEFSASGPAGRQE